MTGIRSISVAIGLAVVATSAGCAALSTPPTQREQTAAMGGLAGGATGAIIGSMAGGAVAGGLFGIPLGAVAGYYIGDQMASQSQDNQFRMQERERELDRLRKENERLREDPRARLDQGQAGRASYQTDQSQGDRASSQMDQGQREKAGYRTAAMRPAEWRQVQKKLNEKGFDPGPVDGVFGPNTQAAIKNFQQAEGLETTGRLNEQTARALGIENISREGQASNEQRSSAGKTDRDASTSSVNQPNQR